ncbi:hypothetical protein [Neokomagataea anthophila]|uniref:Transmembrane protein n=1 Tax=Neokomagataea anthophila TaxID=2826925 RepID=A0ABS5E9Y0_9PROT|nr:hypothetical protein [Neokomagataea anthophila]MBR0560717.1 hypothetical protein [Neokomagataea anthophila]
MTDLNVETLVDDKTRLVAHKWRTRIAGRTMAALALFYLVTNSILVTILSRPISSLQEFFVLLGLACLWAGVGSALLSWGWKTLPDGYASSKKRLLSAGGFTGIVVHTVLIAIVHAVIQGAAVIVVERTELRQLHVLYGYADSTSSDTLSVVHNGINADTNPAARMLLTFVPLLDLPHAVNGPTSVALNDLWPLLHPVDAQIKNCIISGNCRTYNIQIVTARARAILLIFAGIGMAIGFYNFLKALLLWQRPLLPMRRTIATSGTIAIIAFLPFLPTTDPLTRTTMAVFTATTAEYGGILTPFGLAVQTAAAETRLASFFGPIDRLIPDLPPQLAIHVTTAFLQILGWHK